MGEHSHGFPHVFSLAYNMSDLKTLLRSRDLSTSDKINLIIGILTTIIGVLSVVLAWVMWRLTNDRRRTRTLSRYLPDRD
jgi:F0F1-type ATP synthase delta subunit